MSDKLERLLDEKRRLELAIATADERNDFQSIRMFSEKLDRVKMAIADTKKTLKKTL